MVEPTQWVPFVLHVRTVTGKGGGPEKTILNSPRFLRELGYESACAYMHPVGDPGLPSLQQRAAEAGAELLSIPDRGIADSRVIRQLLSICRKRGVSIWHGHDYKSDALGLLLRQFHPMRLVSTVHGWGVRSRRTPFYYAVDRAALRHYDRIVCVSDALLRECVESGIPAGRCCEIANAIDLSAYSDTTDRQAARREFGIRNDEPVVISVGRLSSEKGFDTLIRSVGQLIESGMSANLLIAGDGPLLSELEKLIGRTGHAGRMRLLGHVPDPRRLLAAADAFVLSSRSEGLPNALLEAMACRVPSVVTPVGAVPGVVTDGRNGLLVPVDDADALTVTLTRLLSNSSLQQSLAEAGHRTVKEGFSFASRMKKMVDLYDDLTGRRCRDACADSGTGHLITAEPDGSDVQAAVESGGDVAADRLGRLIASRSFATEHPEAADAESPGGAPGVTTVVARSRPHVTQRAAECLPVRVEVTSSPGAWQSFLQAKGHRGFYQRAEWTRILSRGLKQESVCLQATAGGRLVGVLPLMFLRSRLFGRFLVSLPYLNSAGVVADSPEVEAALVTRAVDLADVLDVRYLELRQEHVVEHPALQSTVTDKVHMRLSLPATTEALWASFRSKVRSQIRKPLASESLSAQWGGRDLLNDFHDVFTRNMRDLGTPPFSRELFAAMLDELGDAAEICVIRCDRRPVASGLLVHGPGVTEVPSASSLRAFNSRAVNMLLYWHLLSRAVERGQHTFDFGRSSRGSGTYRFKAQWGAEESPAVWQHYVRRGAADDMRPGSGRFDLMIQIWQRLPVWLTKTLGPHIVRGIP